jgi:cyclohexanecarboxylate-CoA ligase
VRATWPHDERRAYPELADQPNLETLCATVAARHGTRTVLVDGEVRLTGDELNDRVTRLAGGLRRAGVSRGDVVCFQLPNWWETVVTYRACWRLGAIAAPIHHLAGPTATEGILRALQPTLVLAAPDAPAGAADQIEVQDIGVRGIEVRGDGGFEELLAGPAHEGCDAAPADLAVILHTSGSTGGPKGVLHTHRALAYKARSLLDVHGIDHRDVVLMPAPMAHISGLSNAVMLPGAGGLTSVLMARWSPEAAVDLVRAEGVTFMMGPPTFFQTMMAAPNFGPDAVASMRLISCGGAGVTPAFVEAASAAFGAVVKRTYGSTEAPVVTTWHAGDPPERAVDSDGRAAGAVELRVDERGELLVRGPELFVGYTDPARNDEVITPDDWFRTGDLATLDEDGWLRIVGRIKDMIIRGGENISAAEVEATLEAHPAVRQAVAVGFPDERLGERVAAFVVCDGPFDLETCQEWFARSGATRFTWPERVVILDEMPVLPSSGKPDRAALRARAHELR